MSESALEIYNEMNVAFQLGHYLKVLDSLRTASSQILSQAPSDISMQINSLTAQAYLSLDEKSQEEMKEEMKNGEVERLVELFRQFGEGVEEGMEEERIGEQIEQIEKECGVKRTLISRTVCNSLSLERMEELMAVKPSGEVEALQLDLNLLIALIKIERLDLSRALLNHMNSIDDEHISSILGRIYQHIAEDNYKEALAAIEEIKERHYDSIKLANLKAVCLINSGSIENAFQLMNKVKTQLEKKNGFYDDSEYGVCLHNLAIISNAKGLPSATYRQQLSHLNKPFQHISSRIQHAETLFDNVQL